MNRKRRIIVIAIVVLSVLLLTTYKILTADTEPSEDDTAAVELYLTYDCDLCLETYESLVETEDNLQLFFYPETSIEYETTVATLAARQQNLQTEYIFEIYTNSINNTEDLTDIAQELNMDVDQFITDINDTEVNIEVQSNIEYIENRGIESFPTVIKDNRLIPIDSIQDLDEF